MITGHVMPPSSAILAATIGVTFVGPKNLPQKTMPGFLRVNRNRVHVALQWLKDHNPIYRDITISTERLHQLPVDAVPVEIMSQTGTMLPKIMLHEDDSDERKEQCERIGVQPLHLRILTSLRADDL